MAFLLILPNEGVAGERLYWLTMVWVHPCQSRVPNLDEAVRKLILLASSMAPIGPMPLCILMGMPITCALT